MTGPSADASRAGVSGGQIPWAIPVLLLVSLVAGSMLRPDERAPVLRDRHFGAVRLEVQGDRIRAEADPTATVHYTLDGRFPGPWSPRLVGALLVEGNAREAAALQHVPTSVQWRPPVPGLPTAAVVRACACIPEGCGPVATRTVVPDLNTLPIVALTLEPGALFDPDTGIYVPGHGPFRTNEEAVRKFPADPKWWKYPGNYQFRGREWQRTGVMELFDERGAWQWESAVGVRTNGNNTRGFPQHALRLVFKDPVDPPVFGGREGSDFHAFVLRAAGNDMDRCFFRDALQHRICAGLPFGVSAGEPCVVFINGAYWGIHHLRERVDDDEIGRRYGIDPGRVAIIADRGVVYRGGRKARNDLMHLLGRLARWDAGSSSYADSIDHYLHLDGMLAYLAAQIILENTDWPDQNVKFWRWEGERTLEVGPRDGRWRVEMGDSDMGLGYNGDAEYDMFAHVERHGGPVAQIYQAVVRSPALRERFRAIVLGMLDGPLSSARMVEAVDGMERELGPEMPRHIARWRRPVSMTAWHADVARMRTFATRREQAMRDQLDRYFPR
ncbi:MAG: CotH kinase family protein [Flavobacteriales bacterium]|nr:CotH kinase family protein [Flavobacteriales bacterium]MCB9166355.1 CotH kinase family protein [Flavobacteriales bacterium]